MPQVPAQAECVRGQSVTHVICPSETRTTTPTRHWAP